jgi:hypothetical protein
LSAAAVSGHGLPQDVIIDLDDGTSVTINGSAFVGFTSVVPIVSVTVNGVDSPDLNWSMMDHFYVGGLVPEPASLVLLSLGALLLRRR